MPGVEGMGTVQLGPCMSAYHTVLLNIRDHFEEYEMIVEDRGTPY